MFNDYVWKLYLDAGGRKVVEQFESFYNEDFSESYADFIYNLHAIYCPSEDLLKETSIELENVRKDIDENLGILEGGVSYTIEKALDSMYNLIKSWGATSDQRIFDIFSGHIEYFTTHLALSIPEFFIPYYFQFNFNVLTDIASEFEIEIPQIPQKKAYKDRFYYYGDICAVLIDFREKHNMSPFELYAFLYDFAPRYIGGYESYIITDLPKPRSAYFIGGSKDNKEIAEDPNIITAWQCSPETRAGDMVVMYLRTPISAVDSVWRSVSVGFNDPFFYYYRCTYIAHPIRIQRVTQKQLKEDAVFKDLPIVRKNMQGINGVELKPSEYNHLLKLGKAGRSILKLKFTVPSGNQEFTNEKDVENKLIKPLLKKLGYSEEDYVQQLYIEIGNHNHMLIPDFVLLPNTAREHQTAFAVVEAKYSITKKTDLEAAKIQARSYAVQLRARYAVVVSQEKIWISSEDDDFAMDIFDVSWGELKKADVFSEMFKLIGKKQKSVS